MKKETMEFVTNSMQPEPKPETVKFLDQVLGITKITYEKSKIISHAAPPISISIKGRQSTFYFDREVYNYTVKVCGEKTVTIEFEDDLGNINTTDMTFVDDNMFWSTSEYMPGFREYFSRVEQ